MQPPKRSTREDVEIGLKRSLVANLTASQVVAGANPVSPTIFTYDTKFI